VHPLRPEETGSFVEAATSQDRWSFQGSLATKDFLNHFGAILLPELRGNCPVPFMGQINSSRR